MCDTCEEYTRKVLSRSYEDNSLLINRISQSKLGFISPYEKLWNVKPTVSHFCVSSFVCNVFKASHLQSKFKKKVIISLSGMIARGKDKRVLILLVEDATRYEMWCLMKHFYGALQEKNG